MKLLTIILTSALLVAAAPAPEPDTVTPKALEASKAVTRQDVTPVNNSFGMQYYCGGDYYCPWNAPLCCIAVWPPTCCPLGSIRCSSDGKWCYNS